MAYKNKLEQRAYQLNYVTAKRRKYIEQLGCCFFCGSHDDIQIHHLNPDEKESHRIWSWSDERIENELRKCIAICESCHTKYHQLQRRKDIQHGTLSAYRIGCRCTDCRRARSDQSKLEAHRRANMTVDNKTIRMF